MSRHPPLSELHDADPATITHDTTTGLFVLSVGPPDNLHVVRTGPSGHALSKYAFANGAQSVKHNYDLKLEPNS